MQIVEITRLTLTWADLPTQEQEMAEVPLPQVSLKQRHSLTDEQLRLIFSEVALGRGRLSPFVRCVAEAVQGASEREFQAIKPLLVWLVCEHRIAWYAKPLDQL